jgi:hypothetical protein
MNLKSSVLGVVAAGLMGLSATLAQADGGKVPLQKLTLLKEKTTLANVQPNYYHHYGWGHHGWGGHHYGWGHHYGRGYRGYHYRWNGKKMSSNNSKALPAPQVKEQG